MSYNIKKQYNGWFALTRSCIHGATLLYTDMNYITARIKLSHKRSSPVTTFCICIDMAYCTNGYYWKKYIEGKSDEHLSR